MKKLQLNVESLRVESFATSAAAGKRGTVHAREYDTEFCNNTNNSACFTYGTACWPACGTGYSADDSCDCPSTTDKQTECRDCEI
jgi:hypothetical protein